MTAFPILTKYPYNIEFIPTRRKSKKPRKLRIVDDEDAVGDPEEVKEPIQLRDYQETAVEWILSRFKNKDYRGCMLADDMGTGKTGMFYFKMLMFSVY